MIRNKIKELIKKAINQAQKEKTWPPFKIPEIEIEHPAEEAYGDYSTNVAMIIKSKIKNQKSIEIAEVLQHKLKIISGQLFERIEVAKPGFINFTLSRTWLQEQVGEIVKSKIKNQKSKIKRKVLIEFISANPTGPLHLGHGRGAFWGDTLANVLAQAGFKVEREYYINDAKISGQIKTLGKTALGKSKVYLTDYLKEKIKRLRDREIERLRDGEVGYLLACEIHKDIKKFIEGKLKIKFDRWVSEQNLYEKGKVDEVEKMLRKKNLVYEKEGAVWLKTTEFGDDKDRVLIKKDGQPTYLLPDIAYHKDKFERGRGQTSIRLIDIWGADHLGHIKPLKIGLKILGYDPQNLEILISQMVRIKKKGRIYKMSKRKGKIINLQWLIDEVGLDAVRFLYLMKSLDTQMEFDLDLAKERSKKNPVFYVQYAYARICSILRKCKISNKQRTKNRGKDCLLFTAHCSLLNHPSELDLIRQLIKFPEIVEDIAKDYQVQRLPHYALEVASRFHYFYKCCKVISEDKDLTEARLGLILATKVILESGLKLMRVRAPERM